MGTSSTQAVLLCMTKLPYAGYTILTPLRDRHDARDTRDRGLEAGVYGKVRAACWMSAQRGSAPTRVRPSRRRRCACNILGGELARSLARS